MPSLTRGPHSSSVYWRRRLVLLTVAVILVVAIAKLLDHGSDGSSASPGPDAQGVAQVTSESDSPSTSVSPTRLHPRHSPSPSMPTSTAPAEPTGSCQPSDVVVTPRVDEAVWGQPVSITLEVSTASEPACYWNLTPHSAQVRISRGGSTVWSTVDCGMAIPRQQVVARQDDPASVTLSWAGHRSDTVCSSHDPWAGPGRYWVSAAALGGEPATSSFVMLKTPPAPSSTASPSDSASSSSIATPSSTAVPTGHAKRSPSTSPTQTGD